MFLQVDCLTPTEEEILRVLQQKYTKSMAACGNGVNVAFLELN